MSNQLTRLQAAKPVTEFNYELQVWTIGGVIQRCGHPDSMRCDCTARKFAGRQVTEIQGSVSQ